MVDDYRCKSKIKLSVPLWVAKPNEEVVTDLLKVVASVLEGLINTKPYKLSKQQRQNSDYFVQHILNPWDEADRAKSEEMFSASQNHTTPQTATVCSDVTLQQYTGVVKQGLAFSTATSTSPMSLSWQSASP